MDPFLIFFSFIFLLNSSNSIADKSVMYDVSVIFQTPNNPEFL